MTGRPEVLHRGMEAVQREVYLSTVPGKKGRSPIQASWDDVLAFVGDWIQVPRTLSSQEQLSWSFPSAFVQPFAYCFCNMVKRRVCPLAERAMIWPLAVLFLLLALVNPISTCHWVPLLHVTLFTSLPDMCSSLSCPLLPAFLTGAHC
jgi:hypothetical protein